MTQIRWDRWSGYEVSSKGDSRFSAFLAKMPDGRSIEQWYQCDIKGYAPGSTEWRLGKGKPSLIDYPGDDQYQLYKSLWRLWALHNLPAMIDLSVKAKENGNCLCDRFATTEINQARALSEILNEWFVDHKQKEIVE
jgi:hypothetical protein